MSADLPQVPRGSGQHFVPMVALAANQLDASSDFYAKLLGVKPMRLSPELAVIATASGPALTLRSGTPEGFPTAVPFLFAPDVPAALAKIAADGGAIEREPWNMPMVGTLARFKDPSGTVWGLTSGSPLGTPPHVPMPFGSNPKPAAGTVCSLEMYAADGAAAGQWFGTHFGWGALPTMPHFVAFDPGAGIGGVFQSHTPALPAVPYVYVADVKATLASITASGGQPLGDPMAMPGMATFGYFKDPSGTSMGLIGG